MGAAALIALAFPAIPLIHGLLAGTIAVSSLSIMQMATLADAGVTAVKIGRKVVMIERDLKRHRTRGPSAPATLCFQGAPSGLAARFCD